MSEHLAVKSPELKRECHARGFCSNRERQPWLAVKITGF
jgi:hypothetical protein